MLKNNMLFVEDVFKERCVVENKSVEIEVMHAIWI